MVNETPPENWPSANGIAVASPVMTSTLLPCRRRRSDSASSGSSSMAVIRCADNRTRSVVSPGPGPNSRTSCPRSAPETTHGTRCWMVPGTAGPSGATDGEESSRASPCLSISDRLRLSLAGLARFRYCANRCRKSAKARFSTHREIFTLRSRLSPTTIPQDTRSRCIFMIETNSSMPRTES